MDDRDVGRMGEFEFRQWCAQCGLVPNPPSEDAGGWDFIVQFKRPPPSNTVLALDHMEFPSVFWVQVKSTDTRDAPGISLSNWRKLIEPAFPAFVLLMNFAGGERPVEANLVHVDGEIIAKVLRRLRELGPANTDVLHKRTLSVPWDERNALPELNGAALKKAIEGALGSSPRKYWETKKSWFEDAGYAGARYRMQITTGPVGEQDVLERLIDVGLGLSKELPSTLMSLEEIRFEIPASSAAGGPFPREVTLGFPSIPHLSGVLEVSTSDGTRRARVPCSLFHPWTVFPFIPRERLRYRIATRDLSFVLGFRGDTPAYFGNVILSSLDWSEERSLSEWEDALRLIQMVDDPSLALAMRLSIESTEVKGTIKPGHTLGLDAHARAVVDACVNAATVARVLGIGLDYSVSPRDLDARKDLIAEAARVLTADTSEISITGEVDGAAPNGHQVGLPLVVAAPLGPLLVVAGIALSGPVECGPETEGRKPFRLAKPQRTVVFVDTITMKPEETYSAGMYRKRVVEWVLEKGYDVLPVSDSE